MLPVPPLDSLRQEIDNIDDAIHDLLMRRTEIVEQVKQAKAGSAAMRPAREAVILRRLAKRHRGELPMPALVRMWRELISSLTRLQAPVAVAVYAPDARRTYWDIARDQYGSLTPMIPMQSASAVLRAVTDGSVMVGVVPRPEDGEMEPWWPLLASGDNKIPSVIARLPFCARADVKGPDNDAMAIARLPQERSGDDCSLIVVEVNGELSRSKLTSVLNSANLAPLSVFGLPSRHSNRGMHLIEVADYLTSDDPRLSALLSSLDGARRATWIGSYPRPLDPAAQTKN